MAGPLNKRLSKDLLRHLPQQTVRGKVVSQIWRTFDSALSQLVFRSDVVDALNPWWEGEPRAAQAAELECEVVGDDVGEQAEREGGNGKGS